MKQIAIPGYRIVKTLGVGGQATVYLAIQEGFEREVALKVMSPALAADPSFGDRFIREAKIVARLKHPNIVTVYDVGEHDGFYYLAMEYLPGTDLKGRIKQGLKAKQALSTVSEMASALDYAHGQGYIHRDVKSENILFQADGKPVLTDFGIAKASNSATQMTQAGKLIGTPQYMSPEQCRGKELDGRSDLYSLGVILFEMLTQQVPFDGEDSVAVCLQHVTKAIPKLPARYRHLQWLIDGMMAKKQADRFASGGEIVEQIRQFIKGEKSAHQATVDAMQAVREDQTEVFENEDALVAGERFSPVTAETSSSSSRWIWPLLLVAVLGAGFVFRAEWMPQVGLNPDWQQWFNGALGPQVATDQQSPSRAPQVQAQQQQIADLLVDAKTLDALNDLDVAQLRRLLQNYQRVLVLEPNNQDALAGMDKTMRRVLDTGIKQLAEQDASNYQILKNLLSSNQPGYSGIEELDLAFNQYQQGQDRLASQAAQRAQIKPLLDQANQALNADRLTSPDKQNAVYFYREVLAIDQNNQAALEGIQQVADRYAKLTQQALLNNDIARANGYLTRLEALEQRSNRVKELRGQYATIAARVEKQRQQQAAAAKQRAAEQQRQQKLADPLTQLSIQSKLNSAKSALEQGRFGPPDLDNAYDKYQEVLLIDEQRSEAIEGLEAVEQGIALAIIDAIQNGDSTEASRRLGQLEAIFPDNSRIRILRQQIAEMALQLDVEQGGEPQQ